MAVWSEIKKKRGHGISPPCDNKEKLSFVARQEILANIISGCMIIIEQKISFCESKKSTFVNATRRKLSYWEVDKKKHSRRQRCTLLCFHYRDVILGTMASQITSLTIVYSIVNSGADQRSIKAPRHWPLCGEFTGAQWIPRTNGQLRENVPFDDVIMASGHLHVSLGLVIVTLGFLGFHPLHVQSTTRHPSYLNIILQCNSFVKSH